MFVTYLIQKTSMVVYVLLVQVSSFKSPMLQSVFSVICFILIRTLFIIFRISGPSDGSNLYQLVV